jgi:hypothetical protein
MLSNQKYVIMPIYINLLGLAMKVSIKPTAANIALPQVGVDKQTSTVNHFSTLVNRLDQALNSLHFFDTLFVVRAFIVVL